MTSAENHESDQMLWIAETIHRCGHAIFSVGSGECSVPGCRCEPEPVPWSYTIGRVESRQPELVTFGLPHASAMNVLNWAAGIGRDGPPFVAGDIDAFHRVPVRFDPVPYEWIVGDEDPMGRWFAHYFVGRSSVLLPDVIQLVWADRNGHFPDDPRCAPGVAALQPVGEALLGDWAHRSTRVARRERGPRQ